MILETLLKSLASYQAILLKTLLIIVFGIIFIKKLKTVMILFFDKHIKDPTVTEYLAKIINATVLIVLTILFLGVLGVPTTSLITIVGAAGLTIGLAIKDSIANIISGLFLIILRPFRINDLIDVAGVSGTVEQINLYNTRIRTGNNDGIYIPNAKLLSEKITNKTYKPNRRLDINIGISYDADISAAKTIIANLITEDKRILSEPAAKIAVKALADSAVVLYVRPWVKKADYASVLSALLENIKVALDNNNIAMPYPQLQVHMDKG